MKALICFFILTLWVVNDVVSSTAKEKDVRRLLKERLREGKVRIPIVSIEALMQEIINAYRLGDYERVALLEKDLPPRADLKVEEMLILAEGLWLAGEIENSLDWARRVASLKRGTLQGCQASFILLQGYFMIGRFKEAKEVKTVLLSDFCRQELADEIALFEYLYERRKTEIDAKKASNLLYKFMLPRFSYYLQRGKLDLAEKEAYRYLALSEDYRRGAEFFYRLAEAHFERGDKERAKRFYRLVISEWDLTKESLFSKFRLYQMVFERAKGKERLPAKTYEDLLNYISLIKFKYPRTPIAETAADLEIEVYFEQRNWQKVRTKAKEFISNKRGSDLLPQVLERFCKASVNLSQEFINKGWLAEISKNLLEDEPLLQEIRCGEPFYLVGDYYFQNSAYLSSLGPLTKSFLIGIKPDKKMDLLTKLTFLTYLRGDRELSQDLMSILEKQYKKEVAENPYYLYVKAQEVSLRNLRDSYNLYMKLRRYGLPKNLMVELLNQIFRQALAKGNISFAYEVLENPDFKAKEQDYVLILAYSFHKDPKLFERVYDIALKKFPDSPRMLLISALYHERKGNLRESILAWSRLSEQGSELSVLGEGQKKLEELLNRSRGLIY